MKITIDSATIDLKKLELLKVYLSDLFDYDFKVEIKYNQVQLL